MGLNAKSRNGNILIEGHGNGVILTRAEAEDLQAQLSKAMRPMQRWLAVWDTAVEADQQYGPEGFKDAGPPGGMYVYARTSKDAIERAALIRKTIFTSVSAAEASL